MIEIGLDELQARIREDGVKEITRINEEAKKEIGEITKDIRRKAKARVDRIQRDGEREIGLVRRRVIADANVQVKELMEVEKNNLVDKAFEEAADRILGLDDSVKKKILENLVKEGKVGVTDPVVLVDKKYSNLLDDAKSSDLNDFGVVVVSGDNKLRIDNSLRNRLQRFKITLKPEVASILFSEK